MTITLKKGQKSQDLLRRVVARSGADLSACYQCKRCTAGCPVSKMTTGGPSEVIRRLHLSAGRELLDHDLIWTCVSCQTCSARCPMGIDVAAVMDSLRQLALEAHAAKQKGNVPLFNKAFLETVRIFGRTYDMAMITAYKLGSRKLMDDTEKFPTMLKKGKISLLPNLGGDRKTARRIFKKARTAREGQP
jgi:heterodisulfide reductase subunit C2